MSEKKKKEDEKKSTIPKEILDSLATYEPEVLTRSESCPAYPSENFDIAQILDGKKKKEKEKEYKIGNYLIKKTLGQGTFGKVKLGIYLPSQEKVAIKILEKERILERDDEIRVKREFDMLSLFNHPNVILVAEIFESADKFYTVMEYCDGGELFNFIVKNRRLSEEESAFFYYQLIKGLEYIHSLGIVHRDLKPENLLLTKDHLLKIIDFGLSNYFKKGQSSLLVTPCGSPCYASPEMVAGKKYNGFKIDIWATGIILYAMLCGYLPFEDRDNELLFEKIMECKLEFPSYITDLSKDLIEKILVTDPEKRISIPEIKKHPFYIKGKELFEQEFSICQIEKSDNEENANLNDLNDLNELDAFFDDIMIEDKKKDNNQENQNKKIDSSKKHKINTNTNTDRRKKNNKRLSVKDLNKQNMIQRLNTEFDEHNNNLRKDILKGLDKNEPNKNRNNSSIKKKVNRNKIIRIKNNNNINNNTNNNTNNNNNNNTNNTNINNKKNIKKSEAFKKRDVLYLKNTKQDEKKGIFKKDLKLNDKNKTKDFKNNKKLIKASRYKNITKNKKDINNKRIANSVDARNTKFKKKDPKTLIRKRNNYANIIRNTFNSKENLKRKDKKENNNTNTNTNIYNNNINNTIDEDSLINNKKQFKLDKFISSSVKRTKKPHSVARRKPKLTSLETEYNPKKKKYLDYIVDISSSIKRYENKLIKNDVKINNYKNNSIKSRNSRNIKNDKKNRFDYLFTKNSHTINNNNNKKETKLNQNDTHKDQKPTTKQTRNQLKNPNIKKNILNKSFNIVIKDEDKINTDNNNENKNININSYLRKKNAKYSPKNTNDNYLKSINKIIKTNTNLMNHIRQYNTNIRNNNQNEPKKNYYNEIHHTIDEENKIHHSGVNTDIFDSLDYKTNNNVNINNKNFRDYKKRIFNNNNNNKTEIIEKEKKKPFNKNLLLDSNLIEYNNKLNKTNDSILRTEVSKKTEKRKKIKKPINNYYINEKDKNKFNIFLNYIKNINKTTNNFKALNASAKNPNILEEINASGNYNTNSNSNSNTNNNLIKKIVANNKKSSEIISNNLKKPSFTIKNTVINLNIGAGIFLPSIDKKNQDNKISKRPTNYSIGKIKNNNRIYDLNSKYRNYLTNAAITRFNHSNTNENMKTININSNNYNLLSLNDSNDSNYKINKNTGFPNIYIYDEDNENENVNIKVKKPNKIKEYKINNKSVNVRNNKHMKYKSMKLDE